MMQSTEFLINFKKRQYLFLSTFILLIFISSNLTSVQGFKSSSGSGLKSYSESYFEKKIFPNVTDDSIDEPLGEHLVILNETSQKKNLLWINLHGSGATSDLYTTFLRYVSSSGFHTIGLGYHSGHSVDGVCFLDEDLECYDKIRLEILDGVNRTNKNKMDENPANSIVNRLEKLLLYLNENNPNKGWDQYYKIKDDKIIILWHKIAVSGHSFGTGQAGIIGQQFSTARIVFFAGPNDFSPWFNKHVNWVTSEWQTDTSRVYAINDIYDAFYLRAPNVLGEIGLNKYSPEISIENNTYPFNNTHQLISTNPAIRSHQGFIMDQALPKDDNDLHTVKEAWRYLVISNITEGIDKISVNGNVDGFTVFSTIFLLLPVSIPILIIKRRKFNH